MAGGCERSAHASLCTSVTNVKGGQRDGLVGVNVRPDEVGSKTGTGLVARVGVTLMVSSLPLWLVLPVLPFLPISGATKATIAAMTAKKPIFRFIETPFRVKLNYPHLALALG